LRGPHRGPLKHFPGLIVVAPASRWAHSARGAPGAAPPRLGEPLGTNRTCRVAMSFATVAL